MAQMQTVLQLRITHQGKTRDHILRPHENFTVGRHTKNDLVLPHENIPNHHVLVASNSKSTMLRLPQMADGELIVDKSHLTIRDLKVHRLLPVQKEAYLVPLFQGREARILLGDTQVDIAYIKVPVPQPVHKRQPVDRTAIANFDGFDWLTVTVRQLKQDLYFKGILLFFFLFTLIVLYQYKDVTIVQKTEDLAKQTQRLVKMSMKIIPQEQLNADVERLTALENPREEAAEEVAPDEPVKRKLRKRKSGQAGKKRSSGAANNSAGLLGLIAGSGSSNQSSGVLDFLVDKGLTADLNSAMGSGSDLRKGNGNSDANTADVLAGLIGTGGDGGIGSIDDLIGDYVNEEVSSVKLKKVSKIEIQSPTEAKVSDAAKGYRTQQSINKIVGGVQGRMQYIYEKFLKRDVNFRGKVTIEFTIAASGQVTGARIRQSTTRNSAFDQEILNTIRRLRFPKIPKGTATFVFPFLFQQM